MKAMICTQYGKDYSLKLKDIPLPVAKEHEIVVKVHATSVASALSDNRVGCTSSDKAE